MPTVQYPPRDFTGQGAGKRFEQIVLETASIDVRATFSRYGVQATMFDGEWRPVASLPDFEGVIAPYGRQFCFDCKVCSASKFDLQNYQQRRANQKRQLDHMLLRSEYGAICFFLIHFNERVLKTKTDPRMTVAIPVHGESTLWREFDCAERSSISRQEAAEQGNHVEWIKHGRSGRKLRPDVISCIIRMMGE